MTIHEATEAAYKNGYEAGRRDAMKWIPVTERLPIGANNGETSEEIIAYTKSGEVCVGWIESGRRTWYLVVGDDDYPTAHDFGTVTHWMPLPEAPKEGEK